ncbi:YqaJ viral recombinase family protein [uncultured Methylobacterium sp.]|jgi:predicted phage-related endonuclease|uniref:YqaJ viral recombinase family protein n=1 Tax=uncultured Methylobacterium sp. TaxID=157278 RepID=UPI0026283E8F|nr:YqaJ viral recombinase family protein [uncultured Methylobacterium sp.]
MQTPPPFRRTGHLGMDAAAKAARRSSLGGSDARIIMSGDRHAVEDLWLEKRGESFDTDFSDVLLIQLGNVTEPFNADWFERETGLWVTDMQKKVFHPDWPTAHATLDGLARDCPDCAGKAVFEAKYMLPFDWSIESAVAKYYAQVQHNMWVTKLDVGYLSVITGGGQWKMAEISSDFFYQVALREAEEDFWDAVQTGRLPSTPRAELPIKVERTKVVDMSGRNEWASLAHDLRETVLAAKRHDSAKRKIRKLFPDDAKVAHGHGITMKRGKDGRALFEIEPADAPLANAA